MVPLSARRAEEKKEAIGRLRKATALPGSTLDPSAFFIQNSKFMTNWLEIHSRSLPGIEKTMFCAPLDQPGRGYTIDVRYCLTSRTNGATRGGKASSEDIIVAIRRLTQERLLDPSSSCSVFSSQMRQRVRGLVAGGSLPASGGAWEEGERGDGEEGAFA